MDEKKGSGTRMVREGVDRCRSRTEKERRRKRGREGMSEKREREWRKGETGWAGQG